MNILRLKFDANERAELDARCSYVDDLDGDYHVEGELSEIAHALVRLGLVQYV